MQKVVKQVVQNTNTGEITIEYGDGTTKSYNLDALPVASVVGGNTVLEVFGDTLPSTSDVVEVAQELATVTGDFMVGENLTVTLPTGWEGTYQWNSDGVDILEATDSTYTIAESDEGAVISCKVSDLVYSTTGGLVVAYE